MYTLQSNHFLSKIIAGVVICVALAISTVAHAGYLSGTCSSPLSISFSNASFVGGLGWSSGGSRTISYSGSCSNCQFGPGVYGWGTSPLVEYYIGRSGGSSAGSYSTCKGTFTLYTRSCNGPNLTGDGPFSQYNASGSGGSGQCMGDHYDGWSNLGKGTNAGGGYCVVAVENYNNGSGNATINVSGANWYTLWWGSGSVSHSCGGGSQSPYPGPGAHPIPGRIEAENYDTGGEGVAYHDTTSGNSGGDYRSDDVDVETCGEGGYNVGWIASGEWLEYTVDVDSSDMYDIEIRVASESAGGNFHIEFDGSNVTGTLSFSATGGWQNYTSVFAEDISLSGGQQIMRVSMDSSNWNLNWIEFTSLMDLTPPDPPTGLSATAGDGTVSLDWNDNSEGDLAGYNIYRSTTSGGGPGGYSQIDSLVAISEYTDDTVTNGTTYYYVVTAEDTSSNESDFSNEDSATPIDITPPAPPTGLVATPGDGSVSLDWNDNNEPDLAGYNVYRSLTSGSGYTQLNGPLVTLSEYTDDTVINGTTYYYVVTAEDVSTNESGYSNEDLATPADTTPPAAPTGLVATAGNETVGLDWNDNNEPDLAGYNVYRSTTSGSGYGKLNGPIVTASNYTDDTVTNGIPYYYVVTAVDTNDLESGYSNEDSATPDYQNCADVQAGDDGLTSDLDGDCYVNYVDLEIIVYYWLDTDCSTPGDCEGADFEPDGDVDFVDFSTFGLQWMYCNDPEDPGCTQNW